MEVGPSFSPWIAALELTPFILVPAFLCLIPRTGSQWRALMIAAYAGLALCLLLNLSLPSHGSWGDLPLAGPYGTLAWPPDRPPRMAHYAPPLLLLLEPAHLCIPFQRRNLSHPAPAGARLVVPAMPGPHQYWNNGIRGLAGPPGYHRRHSGLHAPGGQTQRLTRHAVPAGKAKTIFPFLRNGEKSSLPG